jgi:FkbH-like protein
VTYQAATKSDMHPKSEAIRSVLGRLNIELNGKSPSLVEIFKHGERILDLGNTARDISFPVQRIAVIGPLTTDYLVRAIACAVVQENALPVLYQAPFGSYVQEVLSKDSGLHRFSPELVVIATDWRDLITPLPINAAPSEVERELQVKVAQFREMWSVLRELGCRIIQHTIVPPENRFCGMAERVEPSSIYRQVCTLNELLFEEGGGLVHWVDLDALAHTIGKEAWSAGPHYFANRFGFNQRVLPRYLPVFRGAWRGATARTKKVLVLDLDNTLWGGVIGDDGLDEIKLGTGNSEGEAFAEWQHYLKALAERGVILAVCSKNAAEIAEEAFRHPNMILSRTDFAAFECSWSEKTQGLRRIARALNLGLDSFVFADDNPAECDYIRRELPQVSVVELGPDPASFPARLDYGCWFDATRYTKEDFGRARAYAARSAGAAESVQEGNLSSFLTGLEMVGRLYRPREADIPRIVQLEQKTNQFNLTTQRFSEPDIHEFLARDDALVLAFRLTDRFGDHGLVSTLIAAHDNEVLTIESWLMSCRIFSRSAEPFMLRGLVDIAMNRNLRSIIGKYIPTSKNKVVADLFSRLGFTALDGGKLWRRVISDDPKDLISYIRKED